MGEEADGDVRQASGCELVDDHSSFYYYRCSNVGTAGPAAAPLSFNIKQYLGHDLSTVSATYPQAGEQTGAPLPLGQHYNQSAIRYHGLCSLSGRRQKSSSGTTYQVASEVPPPVRQRAQGSALRSWEPTALCRPRDDTATVTFSQINVNG